MTEAGGLVDDDLDTEVPIAGWRIARMQVVNWGGFDGPHEIVFDPVATTLTGSSGAGKSTLLDAYIALMMSAKVPFNNASNAGRGRARGEGQRSVLTYVRGKIDATVEDGETIDRDLRGRANAWGAVAVTFERDHAAGGGETFTAARFWHVPRHARTMEDVRTRFVTSTGDLDLRAAEMDAATQFGNLKSLYGPEVTVHGQFGGFTARLYQRLNIGAADTGDKALDLLANVQAGRPIHDVVGLYRDLVLEEPATFGAAADAVEHFASLDAAHQAMVDAEHQQRVLQPARPAYAAREDALGRIAAIDGLDTSSTSGVFAQWRAQAVLELVADARRGGDERLAAADAAHQTALSLQSLALQRRDKAKAAVHEAAGDLPGIEQQLGDFRAALIKTKTAAAQLENAVGPAGLDVSTATAFAAIQLEAAHALDGDDPQSDGLDEHAAQLRNELRSLAENRTRLHDERADLAARGGKISGADHDIRCQIAALIGLRPGELPYVAELFDVIDEEWRVAADVVLRAFAMQLVIDGATYDRVRDLLDDRKFKNRFRWVGADADINRKYDAAPGTLAAALTVDHTSPWAGWLQQQLLREADHRLVDHVSGLVGGDRVRRVTRAGQVRQGQRGAHGGHTRQLIGFNSQYVLDQLDAQILDIDKEIERANGVLRQVNSDRDATKRRRMALAAVLGATWDSIDVAFAQSLVEEAEADLARAMDANPDLARLRDEAQDAHQQWEARNTEVREAELEMREARAHRQRLDDLEADFRPTLDSAGAAPDSAQLEVLVAACAAVGGLDLLDIDAATQRITSNLQDRRNAGQRETETFGRQLETIFDAYQSRWPDPNRGTAVVSATEYLAILDQLETAGLPTVRARFLAAVNTWSGDDVNAVRSAMETAVLEISSRIEAINQILAAIRFGDPNAPGGTSRDRLVIRLRRTEPDTVIRFRRRLADLSAPVTSSDVAAAADRFDAYRTLSNDLQGPERALLLDVRRHIDITARRVTPDDTVVAEYSTLGGKSGGETQELIAFIVGSALRYRLGGEPTHGPAFAPVLLDEAFIKADARFAGRAVLAWKRLGFQLVIAAPIDKITALEPHVPLTLLVTKNSQGRSSIKAVSRG